MADLASKFLLLYTTGMSYIQLYIDQSNKTHSSHSTLIINDALIDPGSFKVHLHIAINRADFVSW